MLGRHSLTLCGCVARVAFIAALLLPGAGNAQGATAESLANDARAALKIEDYPLAITLLRQRVELINAESGELSPASRTARVMLISVQNSIAQTFYNRGDIAASVPHYREVLTALESLTGPVSKEVSTASYYLARALYSTANYAEALALYKRGYEIDEKLDGPWAPSTGANIYGMATVHDELGQYAQAEPLYRRALAISEKSLGPDHAVTALRLHLMGEFYKALGLYADALPLLQRALTVTEKAQGSTSAQMSERLNSLAALYSTMGDHAAALPLAQRAVALAQQSQGADHPNTANRLTTLSAIQHELGDYALALPTQQRAVAITEKTLGPQHPNYASRLSNLGRIYLALGQPEVALKHFQHALSVSEKALGSNHPIMSVRLGQIARAYEAQGKLEGALRYIPIAALHDGKQYLIEQFDLSLYTEVARGNLAHRPGRDMSIAGFGLTRQIDEFSPLPTVKAELSAIVHSGNTGLIKGELHFDQQFNMANIRQALQNKHALVHVASHFVFRPGNESTSFLLLGDGDRLTLSRIRQEKLDFSHVDLVTLSACETGVGGVGGGRTAQGEEVERLGALVQKQGAKGVITTLWPVADESTGLLMQNFYKLREEKKLSKADALRQAQLMLVRGQLATGASAAQRGLDAPASPTAKPSTSTYAHPYYWAPFILMGNWL